MAKGVVRTLLIAVVLATGSAWVPAGQAPQPKNTPALGETFVAAQEAIEARQWDVAEARAREILASPRKSPDDAYVAFSFLMEVGWARRDMARQIEAMEGMLNCGFQPGTAQQNVLRRGLMSAH